MIEIKYIIIVLIIVLVIVLFYNRSKSFLAEGAGKVLNGEKKQIPIASYPDYVGLIQAHLETHLGKVSQILTNTSTQQQGGDGQPITIFAFAPTPDRNFYILATAGMSDAAGGEDIGYELMMALSKEMAVPSEENFDPNQYQDYVWGLQLLEAAAHYSHQMNTSLGFGHTIPCRNNPVPSNNQMTHILFGMPLFCDVDVSMRVSAQDGEPTVLFLGVYPLYEAEYDYKVNYISKDEDAHADLEVDLHLAGMSAFNPKRPCLLFKFTEN